MSCEGSSNLDPLLREIQASALGGLNIPVVSAMSSKEIKYGNKLTSQMAQAIGVLMELRKCPWPQPTNNGM